MMFSARFFSDCASARHAASSSSDQRPRAAVPFIGRVEYPRASPSEEELGRGGKDFESSRVEVRAEARGLRGAQALVEGEGVAAETRPESERVVGLIRVAARDGLAHLSHVSLVRVARLGRLPLRNAVPASAAALSLRRFERAGASKSPNQTSGVAASRTTSARSNAGAAS